MKHEKIDLPKYDPTLKYDLSRNFDKYDKIIIKELDEDCRISFTDLSKKVGLTREAVKNRIKKLIDQKIIVSFKPIFNPPHMGYPIYNYIFFSLYNPTEEKEEEFIKYIKNNKYMNYLASSLGRWDYMVGICCKNNNHFDAELKAIRRKFHDFIKDYEVLNLLQEYKFETYGDLVG